MRYTVTLAGRQHVVEVTAVRAAVYERLAEKPFSEFNPERVGDLLDFFRAFLLPQEKRAASVLAGLNMMEQVRAVLGGVGARVEFAEVAEVEKLIPLDDARGLAEVQIEVLRVYSAARGKALTAETIAELRADAGLTAGLTAEDAKGAEEKQVEGSRGSKVEGSNVEATAAGEPS